MVGGCIVVTNGHIHLLMYVSEERSNLTSLPLVENQSSEIQNIRCNFSTCH